MLYFWALQGSVHFCEWVFSHHRALSCGKMGFKKLLYKTLELVTVYLPKVNMLSIVITVFQVTEMSLFLFQFHSGLL